MDLLMKYILSIRGYYLLLIEIVLWIIIEQMLVIYPYINNIFAVKMLLHFCPIIIFLFWLFSIYYFVKYYNKKEILSFVVFTIFLITILFLKSIPFENIKETIDYQGSMTDFVVEYADLYMFLNICSLFLYVVIIYKLSKAVVDFEKLYKVNRFSIFVTFLMLFLPLISFLITQSRINKLYEYFLNNKVENGKSIQN